MIEQLLLNGIIAGSIYSLVALGFSLIYQTTRFLFGLTSLLPLSIAANSSSANIQSHYLLLNH